MKGRLELSSQRVSGTAVQRTIAVLGSAVFFVVAPFTLAGLVPWSITGWQRRPPFLGLELTRGIGAIMILAGVPGVVDAFARFELQGLGTPAPIAPPRNLVVSEEPTLERMFGGDYEAFRAAVPRWIPRITQWRSN